MLKTGFLARGVMALLLAAAGCGRPDTSGSTSRACRALGTSDAAPRPLGLGGTVFTIVMENHSYDDVIGSPEALYINSLAAQGAVAAGYHDSYVHPSEPNYIWMVAGENFGILNDADPNGSTSIDTASHLADQIEAAGLTWKSYQESMGAPCGLRSHGRYAVKHNPFVYFSDVNGWDGTQFAPSARCDAHVVDYGELDRDLAAGSVPDYAFITPDLDHDMHDGSVAEGDRWLATEVPKILASDAYRNGGVLFLLWDEGSGQTDDPPFIVVSPGARAGFVSQTDYDTSSYLETVQAILGLELLPCAEDPGEVSTMDDLFTVPLVADASARVSGSRPAAR